MATKTTPKNNENQTTQPAAPTPAQPAQQMEPQASFAIVDLMKPDVRVYLNNNANSRTRATCSATLFGSIAIRGIHVVQGQNGLFVQMPQYVGANREYKDYVFPVTKEARAVLIDAVKTAYEQQIALAQQQFAARQSETFSTPTAQPGYPQMQADPGFTPIPEPPTDEDFVPFTMQPDLSM